VDRCSRRPAAARARIAGLAAGRATREEIAEMERILEEQHQEVLQGRTGVVQDTALHSAIAHRADNRAITRIVSALMDLLTLSREESLHTPGRPTRSHADQRRILEAIQRRDEGAAHRSMPGPLDRSRDAGHQRPGSRPPRSCSVVWIQPAVDWAERARPHLQPQATRGAPGARRGTRVQANVGGCWRYWASVA